MAKKTAATSYSLNELLPGVSFCRTFTSVKAIVPIQQHLVFKDSAVHAFNGTAGASADLPWDIPPCTVPADLFGKVLDSLALQGVAAVELVVEGQTVKLVGGDTTVRFTSLPLTDFGGQWTPPKKAAATWTLPKSFWERVLALQFAVCQNETKPELRGHYWSGNGVLYAADNFRLVRQVMDPDKAKVATGVLLPDHLLSRCGSKLGLVETMQLTDGLLWVYFPDGMRAYGALVAAEFPAAGLQEIFATADTEVHQGKHSTTVTWDLTKADLDFIYKRLSLFVEPLSAAATVMLTAKSMVVQVGEGTQQVTEKIPAIVAGPVGQFTANLRNLFDGLLRSTGMEVVLEDASCPLYLTDGLGLTYLTHRYEH